MAKLIRYMDGQKWELEIPDNDIANIFAAIVLGVAIGLLIVLLRVYEFI